MKKVAGGGGEVRRKKNMNKEKCTQKERKTNTETHIHTAKVMYSIRDIKSQKKPARHKGDRHAREETATQTKKATEVTIIEKKTECESCTMASFCAPAVVKTNWIQSQR